MLMRLVYLKLELKRAFKRLPALYAGAIMLFAMAGVIALLSNRMLYDDAAVGRVAVGVALPKEDAVAKKVVQMISSLDSVKSVCDFRYMDRESCLEGLEQGDLYAVLDVPEGFVQDIMNGTNTPVTVWMAEDTGIEGRIFQQLADAGARTLSASQAGIYAGNELYRKLGIEEAISQLEQDLNVKYMDYSLQRSVYFRHQRVQAIGDVDVLQFYMLSAFVVFLFLAVIPGSSFLAPWKPVIRQKLELMNIGRGYQMAVRIAAIGALLIAVSLPVVVAAVIGGVMRWSLILAVVWPAVCLAVAAVVAVIYQAAGNLMSGIMLLFLAVVSQHFVAGGFLPAVFLPASLQKAAPWMPSAILIDGLKMAVTENWEWQNLLRCIGIILISWLVCVVLYPKDAENGWFCLKAGKVGNRYCRADDGRSGKKCRR